MSCSKEQIDKLMSFDNQYKEDEGSYYYNAIHEINPAKSLRYQVFSITPLLSKAENQPFLA
jgi:hypothetical protein